MLSSPLQTASALARCELSLLLVWSSADRMQLSLVEIRDSASRRYSTSSPWKCSLVASAVYWTEWWNVIQLVLMHLNSQHAPVYLCIHPAASCCQCALPLIAKTPMFRWGATLWVMSFSLFVSKLSSFHCFWFNFSVLYICFCMFFWTTTCFSVFEAHQTCQGFTSCWWILWNYGQICS